MKFDDMMKAWDVTQVTANVETAQKSFFDNAETVVKTFYGISEGNLKMAREMTEKFTKSVNK